MVVIIIVPRANLGACTNHVLNNVRVILLTSIRNYPRPRYEDKAIVSENDRLLVLA